MTAVLAELWNCVKVAIEGIARKTSDDAADRRRFHALGTGAASPRIGPGPLLGLDGGPRWPMARARAARRDARAAPAGRDREEALPRPRAGRWLGLVRGRLRMGSRRAGLPRGVHPPGARRGRRPPRGARCGRGNGQELRRLPVAGRGVAETPLGESSGGVSPLLMRQTN